MPRGRKPAGDRALTGAERQARYRAAHSAALSEANPVIIRQRRPGRAARPGSRRSRPQRWHAAVSQLRALQAEYATWLDSLPQASRSSPSAEALQTILDLDLDELSAIEPPRGFGRD
jgi:hypothetical protein